MFDRLPVSSAKPLPLSLWYCRAEGGIFIGAFFLPLLTSFYFAFAMVGVEGNEPAGCWIVLFTVAASYASNFFTK